MNQTEYIHHDCELVLLYGASTMDNLENFRLRIDQIDDKIIDLLAERFEIVRAVGHFKAINNIAPVQQNRVLEVLERVTKRAQQLYLDQDLVHKLYTLMIDHAHTVETGIRERTRR